MAYRTITHRISPYNIYYLYAYINCNTNYYILVQFPRLYRRSGKNFKATQLVKVFFSHSLNGRLHGHYVRSHLSVSKQQQYYHRIGVFYM